jgi:hypothetical protein
VHDPPERCRGARYHGFLGVVFELLDIADRAPTPLNEQTVSDRMASMKLSRDFVGGIIRKLNLLHSSRDF